jgi:serine/threonine protein kinase
MGNMAKAPSDLHLPSSLGKLVSSASAKQAKSAAAAASGANATFNLYPPSSMNQETTKGAGRLECPTCRSTAGSNEYIIELTNKLRAHELRHIQEKLTLKNVEIELQLLRTQKDRLMRERNDLQKKVEDYQDTVQAVINENNFLREQNQSMTPGIEWQSRLDALEGGGAAAMTGNTMAGQDDYDDISIDLAACKPPSTIPPSSFHSSHSSSFLTTSQSSTSLSEASLSSDSTSSNSSCSDSSEFGTPQSRVRTSIAAVAGRKHLVTQLTEKLNSSIASMGDGFVSVSPAYFHTPRASMSSKLAKMLQKFDPERSARGLSSCEGSISSPVPSIQATVASRVRAVENVPGKEMHRRLLMELNKNARRANWQTMRARFHKSVKYHGAVEVATNKSVKRKPVDFSTFVPPTHANKSESQRALILAVVQRNFIFSEFRATGHARTSNSLEALIDAFEVVAEFQSRVLWPAGDQGEKQAFYIVDRGSVNFFSESKEESVGPGACFGEQSLIHAEASLFTVSVSSESSNTVLLKLDPLVYRGLLQLYSKKSETEKQEVLMMVDFVERYLKKFDKELAKKMVSTMVRIEFSEGDTFDTDGDEPFFVIESGTVKSQSSDYSIGAGGYFCNPSLMTMVSEDAPFGRFTATNDGVGFKIEPKQLEDKFGISNQARPPLRRATSAREDKPDLSKEMIEVKLGGSRNELVVDIDDPVALYVMQDGIITVHYNDGLDSHIMKTGDMFGHDRLEEMPTESGGSGLAITDGFTATVLSDEARIGKIHVQSREDLAMTIQCVLDDKRSKTRQLVEASIALEDLKKIKLLGEGHFGEVWLVEADKAKIGQGENIFALKSQSKADGTRGSYALDEIRMEIEVLKQLDHTGIANLIQTFEDTDNIYMLLRLIPGGELLGRIYQETPSGDLTSGLPEDHARFYGFVIADTLAFVHSKQYVFRDLKPENVLIDADGYPVIVDFGFAKHVPEGKTYTFCGTPNYVAPEIILNSGHNQSVDHWALGITLYEMVTGENPFFFEGMDNITLYDTICREDPYPLKPEQGRSKEFVDLIDRLLEKDPAKRLGMLAGGMDDVLSHPWFDAIDTLKLCAKSLPAPWRPLRTSATRKSVDESADQGTTVVPDTMDDNAAPKRKKKKGDKEKKKRDKEKKKRDKETKKGGKEKTNRYKEKTTGDKQKKKKKLEEQGELKATRRKSVNDEAISESVRNQLLSSPKDNSLNSLGSLSYHTPLTESKPSLRVKKRLSMGSSSLSLSQHSGSGRKRTSKFKSRDALSLSRHRKEKIAKSLDDLGS